MRTAIPTLSKSNESFIDSIDDLNVQLNAGEISDSEYIAKIDSLLNIYNLNMNKIR